jgi:hypothetical protein
MPTNKSHLIQIQPTSGLDMDTDPSQVAVGDYSYALNARVHSSNKYNVSGNTVDFNLGERRSIKPYFGENSVTTLWRNWAGGTVSAPSGSAVVCGFLEGNGEYNRGYFVFRKWVPTSEYNCRISYFRDGVDYLIHTLPSLGLANNAWLNFDFTALCQIDDYLYFVGPDNLQYKLPIQGFPAQITSGALATTNPFRLIKIKPLGAPELNIATSGTIYQQKTSINEPRVVDGVQFAYAYKWYDGTITTLSYFSQVFPLLPNENYTLKHSSEDDSNASANGLRNLGVTALKFYFRKSDTGLWYEFEEFTLNGTTVSVTFRPTVTSGIALPTNKQNKYFEAIPLTSKALETVNGRIFLGNNRMSYTPPVVPNSSDFAIDQLVDTFTFTYTNTNITTATKRKSFKSGGIYNVGIYGVDAFGRPTPITKLITVNVGRDLPILFDTGSLDPALSKIYDTRNVQNGISIGINNDVVFPEGITQYGYAVTKCLNISLFLTGVAGWLYAYEADATQSAQFSDAPFLPYLTNTADLSNAFFTPTRPAPSNVAVFLNAGEGYQWKAGDRLKVINGYYANNPWSSGNVTRPTQPCDYEIIQVFGNVLILEQGSGTNWYISVGGGQNFNYIQYEIYRPEVVAGDQVYYAASPLYPTAGRPSDPTTNLKDLEGDVMLLPFGYSATAKNKVRYQLRRDAYFDFVTPTPNILLPIPAVEVTLFKECTTWSVNFPYDQTWNNRTLGWINQPLTINSQIPLDSQTHICFSDVKIAATEVDGTGNFDALNYTIYPQEYGPISKLIRVADNQLESVGALLMALFQKETVSIYISRVTLQEITGVAQVLLSDKILGSFNAQLGSCGCINPESVIKQDGRVYFWDGTKRRVIRYSRDGLTAISEFGMSTHFGQFNMAVNKVYSGYDFPNNELYLTFKTTPALDNPTYVWNETVNRWVTLHTVNPQYYGTNGEYSNFTYFRGGLARVFTNVQFPSTFNGDAAVTPVIDFIVNPELMFRKTLKAVRFYKGFTEGEGDNGFTAFFSKGYDYFSNKTQITGLAAKPQANFDGKETLDYSFQLIPQDQLRTYNDTSAITSGDFEMFFLYGILRVSLGGTRRGIYLIDLQYQTQDPTRT